MGKDELFEGDQTRLTLMKHRELYLCIALLSLISAGCSGEASFFIAIGDDFDDATPPQIEGVQPPIGTVIPPGSIIAVTLFVSDNQGVREVRLVAASIPGIDFPDITPLAVKDDPPFTFTFSFPKPGVAFLTFEVLDFQSNSAGLTVTYQVATLLP